MLLAILISACLPIIQISFSVPSYAVPGIWSEWSAWTNSGATCSDNSYIPGVETRTRTCSSSLYGACQGDAIETRNVILPKCPVKGNWGKWTLKTAATQTCSDSSYDKGVETWGRLCNNPPPSSNDISLACVGDSTEIRYVDLKPCPVKGDWCDWTLTNEASQTCIDSVYVRGFQIWSRFCNNPSPSSDDLSLACVGDSSEYRYIDLPPCPVIGCWGNWTLLIGASQTCTDSSYDKGVETWGRLCNNPPPSSNDPSLACVGDKTEDRYVNLKPCPVKGNWSNWTLLTGASRTCVDSSYERGVETWSRLCNNPPPSDNDPSLDCIGDKTEKRYVDLPSCPMKGNWCNFTLSSGISQTCTDRYYVRGEETWGRFCNNPPPSNNDSSLACIGDAIQKKIIDLPPCPVKGNWGNWTRSTGVRQTCTDSSYVRGEETWKRLCNNPSPSSNDSSLACIGDDTKKVLVDLPTCPVKGNWGNWTKSLSVRQTCTDSSYLRGEETWIRLCNNPPPSSNDSSLACIGDNIQKISVALPPCPVKGNWGNWTKSISARQTCTDSSYLKGEETWKRFCNNPSPSSNLSSLACIGDNIQVRFVALPPCPMKGNWGYWTKLVGARQTCTDSSYLKGEETWTRLCNNPSPSSNASSLACVGDNIQKRPVALPSCPSKGNWGNWTKSIGVRQTCTDSSYLRGEETWIRLCNNPPPSSNDSCLACIGPNIKKILVPLPSCPVRGNWSEWTRLTGARQTCTDSSYVRGEETWIRFCNNPLPSSNDSSLACIGDNRKKIYVDLPPCPVKGKWCDWTLSVGVSQTCTDNSYVRGEETWIRYCNNPPPSSNDPSLACVGDDTEKRFVKIPPCPIVCPPDFEYQNDTNRCYKLITTRADWLVQRDNCNKLNKLSHLPFITSTSDQNDIECYLNSKLTIIQKNCLYYAIWTAGQCSGNTGFSWKPFSNDERQLDYTNWNAERPDYDPDTDQCISICRTAEVTEWKWNNNDCVSSSYSDPILPMCALCEISMV